MRWPGATLSEWGRPALLVALRRNALKTRRLTGLYHCAIPTTIPASYENAIFYLHRGVYGRALFGI